MVIGCLSYSNEGYILKSIGWSQVVLKISSYHIHYYFGLNGFYVTASVPSTKDTYEYYNNCVDIEFCKNCRTVGFSVYIMILISILFSFSSIICTIIRINSNNLYLKIICVICSIISCTLPIVSIGIYINLCYKSIINEFHSSSAESSYHSIYIGYSLVVISIIFMFMNMIVHLIVSVENKNEFKIVEQNVIRQL